MKKLGKLTINPEKVIKNDELVNLKGGGYGEYGTCVCCTVGGNSGACDSTGYFEAPYNNCDDAMDWAYYICGSHNLGCDTSITCSPFV